MNTDCERHGWYPTTQEPCQTCSAVDKVARLELQVAELQEENQDLRNLKEKLMREKYTQKQVGETERLIEIERGLNAKVRCDCGVPGCNMLYDHRK